MPDLLDIALSDWDTSPLTPPRSGPSQRRAEGESGPQTEGQPGPQAGTAGGALGVRFAGRGTGRIRRLIFKSGGGSLDRGTAAD